MGCGAAARASPTHDRDRAVTSRTVRSLGIGFSFVVCALLGASEASSQVCLKEAAEVQRLKNEALAAIPKPPQITNVEYNKRRTDELSRANHCYNLLRRQGADCKALLQAYMEGRTCG
jgi:hypothetical protein